MQLERPRISKSASVPDPESDRAWAAMSAIGLLDDAAVPAIPELTEMMKDPRRPLTSRRATVALAYIGPAGVPALLEQLANTNGMNRALVAELLADSEDRYANNPAVIDMLVQCTDDEDERVREQAALSLVAIAKRKSRPPAPLMMRGLTNSLHWHFSVETKRGVLRAINAYGAEAQAAIPQLAELVYHPDGQIRNGAVDMLGRLSPGVLSNALANPKQVLQLFRNKSEAISALKQTLGPEFTPWFKVRALESLSEFGPAAIPALDEIKALLADSDPSLRNAATNALLQIAPEVLTDAPPQ